MWTDTKQRSFMAVTAHWIQEETIQTSFGSQVRLKMQTVLIGFHHVPGRHTGEHLAEAFIFILECVGILHKVCVSLLGSLTGYLYPFRLGGLPRIMPLTIIHCWRH